MNLPERKIKPALKLADDVLGLKKAEPGVIVQHLEEQMKLRELPLEKHILRSRKRLSRDE
jgi:hypothetical protein